MSMNPHTAHRLGACLLLLTLALGALPACHPGDMSTARGEQVLREALALAQEAQEADKAGNFGKAVELDKKALALQPDMGGVWNNYGLALMHRGTDLDFLEASQAFKRAADLLANDERPYQNLGVLYHERGFSEEALRYFNMSLERNPNSLDSLRGAVASAKRLLKSDDAGLARLNRALMIETDPQWRRIFEFERLRVQQDLSERGRNG